MGPWSYYAPLWLGLLLPFGMQHAVFAHPTIAGLSPAAQWPALVLLGIVTGIQFQLLMVGAQGAFAQVLPVPGGRSIRGRAAVVGGTLTISAVLLLWIAFLLRPSDGFSTPATIVIGCSAAAALLAMLIYLWSLPMAARDFASR
jgi:hypothetical protein